jgi:hypothetical protein
MPKLLLALSLVACGGSPDPGTDASLSPECHLTTTGQFNEVYGCTTDMAWVSIDQRTVFVSHSHYGRSIDIELDWATDPVLGHHYTPRDAAGAVSFDAGSDYNGYVWTAEDGRGSYDLVFTWLDGPYPNGDDRHWWAHGQLTSTLEPYNGSGQGSDMTLTVDF